NGWPKFTGMTGRSYRNPHIRHYIWRRLIAYIALLAFIFDCLAIPLQHAYAQEALILSEPGVRIGFSPPFAPPVLKGVKVYSKEPFRFDFILDKGDSVGTEDSLKLESARMIRYFLASLTVPEKDLWVNLSPFEKERIVPAAFGQTEMGRDLLAEDYLLKQLTASVIYPETDIGKKFWARIYQDAFARYGTTDVPVDSFNKVWITPQKAVVYENAKAGTAYVVESRLKVMLEKDYLAAATNAMPTTQPPKVQATQVATPTPNDSNNIAQDVLREIVIPVLEKEVNEGANFAHLRQVYNALILATWYKQKIKDSVLAQVYTDRNKIAGVNIDDPQEKEKIYQRYLEAFRKGVYSYIKEEQDPYTNDILPRKYFSGGVVLGLGDAAGGAALQFRSDVSGVALISNDKARIVVSRIDRSQDTEPEDDEEIQHTMNVENWMPATSFGTAKPLGIYFEDGGLLDVNIMERWWISDVFSGKSLKDGDRVNSMGMPDERMPDSFDMRFVVVRGVGFFIPWSFDRDLFISAVIPLVQAKVLRKGKPYVFALSQEISDGQRQYFSAAFPEQDALFITESFIKRLNEIEDEDYKAYAIMAIIASQFAPVNQLSNMLIDELGSGMEDFLAEMERVGLFSPELIQHIKEPNFVFDIKAEVVMINDVLEDSEEDLIEWLNESMLSRSDSSPRISLSFLRKYCGRKSAEKHLKLWRSIARNFDANGDAFSDLRDIYLSWDKDITKTGEQPEWDQVEARRDLKSAYRRFLDMPGRVQKIVLQVIRVSGRLAWEDLEVMIEASDNPDDFPDMPDDKRQKILAARAEFPITAEDYREQDESLQVNIGQYIESVLNEEVLGPSFGESIVDYDFPSMDPQDDGGAELDALVENIIEDQQRGAALEAAQFGNSITDSAIRSASVELLAEILESASKDIVDERSYVALGIRELAVIFNAMLKLDLKVVDSSPGVDRLIKVMVNIFATSQRLGYPIADISSLTTIVNASHNDIRRLAVIGGAMESFDPGIRAALANVLVEALVNMPIGLMFEGAYKSGIKLRTWVLPLLDYTNISATDRSILIKKIELCEELIDDILGRFSKPDDQQFYVNKFAAAFQVYDPVFKKNDPVAEIDAIARLSHTIYLNLSLALTALGAAGVSVSEMADLITYLDQNNALTKILSMLGEEGSLGGHKEVVTSLVAFGQFGNFKSLLMMLVKRWWVQSPQVIDGVLILLEQMSMNELKKLSPAYWQAFGDNINEYFRQGFKIFDPQLFEYFMNNRGKPEIIAEFRTEVLNETQNIAYGDFNGFSQRFMGKYDIKPNAVVALIGRYIPIKNQTAREYSGMYVKLAAALKKRVGWREEVDPLMREQFDFRPVRVVKSYMAATKVNSDLYRSLNALAGKAEMSFEEFLAVLTTNPDEFYRIKDGVGGHAFLQYLFQVAQVETAGYGAEVLSKSDNDKFDFLSQWASFLNDAKLEHKPVLESRLREIVAGMAPEVVAKLKVRHGLANFRFFEFEAKKLLPKVEDLMETLGLPESEAVQKLAKHFGARLSQFPSLSLRDEGRMAALREECVALVGTAIQRRPELQGTEGAARKALEAAFALARSRVLAETGDRTDEDRIRTMLADRISSELITLLKTNIRSVEDELKKFQSREVPAEGESLKVGFFDDLLHLMSFMASGVCTWVARDRQVLDPRTHFGKIAIKDDLGRVLGVSQVQLSRTKIKGLPAARSERGWSVLAMPGINLFHEQLQGNQSTSQLVLAILKTAQLYAKEAGMQGAFIPNNPAIYTNHNQERKVIEELVQLGWLKPVELEDDVQLSVSPAPNYSYLHGFLVCIPVENTAVVLRKSSVPVEKIEDRRVKRLGMSRTHDSADELVLIPKEREVLLQGDLRSTVERVLQGMPSAALTAARSNVASEEAIVELRVNRLAVESSVIATANGFMLELGSKVLADGSPEATELGKAMADLVSAVVLGRKEWVELKTAAIKNENAYFKLGLIRGLLLYKSGSARLQEVGEYIKGVEHIAQWNVFLNVMDGADPDILINNYVAMLWRDRKASDRTISRLFLDLVDTEVLERVSLARMREVFRAFILSSQARLMVGDKIQPVEQFKQFDQQEDLLRLNQQVLGAATQNDFYSSLKTVLEVFLPSAKVNTELGRLLNNDLYKNPDRPQAVRAALQEICVRYYGQRSFDALNKHLTASRGSETIPYIRYKDLDLNVGDDLDQYEFLEFVSVDQDHVNYDLLSEKPGQEPESMSGADWVRSLFKMSADSAMADPAAVASEQDSAEKKGGIDLTADKVKLATYGDSGNGLTFKIDPAMLQQLQNAPGFRPVSISLQPVTTSVSLFLGMPDN
ncbi:MAG: hypothetical protein HQL20_04675, partial [Candidatus Omnitrophica bacterium]|nr:hypothetical protein [Candidatus Omnitrophota bacterium]